MRVQEGVVCGTQRCEKVQHVEHKVAHKSSAGGAWGCRKARRVVHNGVRRRWGDVICGWTSPSPSS
jgi:hypothetical protein